MIQPPSRGRIIVDALNVIRMGGQSHRAVAAMAELGRTQIM